MEHGCRACYFLECIGDHFLLVRFDSLLQTLASSCCVLKLGRQQGGVAQCGIAAMGAQWWHHMHRVPQQRGSCDGPLSWPRGRVQRHRHREIDIGSLYEMMQDRMV